MSDYTMTSAVISTDGLYRYGLHRRWSEAEGPCALFVMLNPSTADADKDDPTIRRCVSFAKREGCVALNVVNLYAFRATNPEDLWRCEDPVGPSNDAAILTALHITRDHGGPVIAAWGAHAKPFRAYAVKSLPGMENAVALGFTKAGAPGHPLYIRGDAPLLSLATGEPITAAERTTG